MAYKHPTEAELAEISFTEDVERQARLIVTSGGAIDLQAAIAMVRPQMEKERARLRQEEADEKAALTDNFAPGRAGRRRGGVAIV